VLAAATEEDLQTLIDVVADFCTKWRMTVNLKKSEVMVVRSNASRGRCSCKSPEGCELCQSWTCNDKMLKVVQTYKYLGIWFSADLRWDIHIKKAVAKARERTDMMMRILRNYRLPPRARILAWLARVRPLLEYGCQVWRANSKQRALMDAEQLYAASSIFRLNRHTHRYAQLALLHVPPLKFRWDRANLNYIAKLWSMKCTRLARKIIKAPIVPAARGCGHTGTPWWEEQQKLVQEDEEVKRAYKKVTQSAGRNGGRLPRDLDPVLLAREIEYRPVKAWRKFVKKRTGRQWLQAFMHERSASTLALLRQTVLPDVDELPSLPLTWFANMGADKHRLRLLTGTSALNATLSHWHKDRPKVCPFEKCDINSPEDTVHFLLHCRGGVRFRAAFRARLWDSCGCARRIGSGGAQGCAEFFETLNDAEKAVFILGGPVRGRTPEPNIDACSREFVRLAYKARSDALNASAEEPLFVDLTANARPEPPRPAGVVPLNIFGSVAAHSNHVVQVPRTPSRPRIARPAIGVSSERQTGRGLYDFFSYETH
jgi:hypothetical protein